MQGLRIEVSAIEELSDKDIEILLNILEQVEEITITEDNIDIGTLLSIDFYNDLKGYDAIK